MALRKHVKQRSHWNGAIVMDNCEIDKNCIIAAGAVLLEGTKVESGSIYAGVPVKKVKDLSSEMFASKVQPRVIACMRTGLKNEAKLQIDSP